MKKIILLILSFFMCSCVDMVDENNTVIESISKRVNITFYQYLSTSQNYWNFIIPEFSHEKGIKSITTISYPYDYYLSESDINELRVYNMTSLIYYVGDGIAGLPPYYISNFFLDDFLLTDETMLTPRVLIEDLTCYYAIRGSAGRGYYW